MDLCGWIGWMSFQLSIAETSDCHEHMVAVKPFGLVWTCMNGDRSWGICYIRQGDGTFFPNDCSSPIHSARFLFLLLFLCLNSPGNNKIIMEIVAFEDMTPEELSDINCLISYLDQQNSSLNVSIQITQQLSCLSKCIMETGYTSCSLSCERTWNLGMVQFVQRYCYCWLFMYTCMQP